MKLYDPTRWLRSALLALPLAATPVVLDQAGAEFGFAPLAAAVAQEGGGDQRETRRTPALRNAVYEKLSEAQAAADEAVRLAEESRMAQEVVVPVVPEEPSGSSGSSNAADRKSVV